MKTISSGYKLEKVRLLLDLKDSSDLVIQIANACVCSGRKCEAPQLVHQAIICLKHQEVMGLI